MNFLFNMYFRKLATPFHITSIPYFEKLGFSYGFVAFHLQLKTTIIAMKVPITHILYL